MSACDRSGIFPLYSLNSDVEDCKWLIIIYTWTYYFFHQSHFAMVPKKKKKKNSKKFGGTFSFRHSCFSQPMSLLVSIGPSVRWFFFLSDSLQILGVSPMTQSHWHTKSRIFLFRKIKNSGFALGGTTYEETILSN